MWGESVDSVAAGGRFNQEGNVSNGTDDERSERSRRYPASTVVDAIGNLTLVHRGVGMNGGSREALAQAIGHTTLNGASKRKIASLIQYGLIDRDGDRYRISDLGRRILIPVNGEIIPPPVSSSETRRIPAILRA